MGNIFRNKFFIIFLIIACVLTITTMSLHLAGYGNLVSDAANTILQPFQAFANMIKNSVSGFTDYFTQFNKLKEENAELHARINELENFLDDAGEAMQENKSLRTILELKEERLDFKLQDASVIAGSSSNYMSGLTIDKGEFHGIKNDMAVIAADGEVGYIVVGYIYEVGFRTSKVSPFIRASNTIGAYIKRAEDRMGDTGLVEGVFELEKESLCKMTHLSKDSDIKVGDRIYSSGYGEIYPEGLFIGKVVEVYSDSLTQTPAAYIEPAVNFNKVRDVMVILEYDWVLN